MIFETEDISGIERLELFEDNTFIQKEVLSGGCETTEFPPKYSYSELKGTFNISNDNILELKPSNYKGAILTNLDLDFHINFGKIDPLLKAIKVFPEKKYDSNEFQINTKFKILRFSIFDVLIELKAFDSEKEYNYEYYSPTGIYQLANMLNSSNILDEFLYQDIRNNFLCSPTPLKNLPLSKKILLDNSLQINNPEILKKPITASIKPIKNIRRKNKFYNRKYDAKEDKFISESIIEIDAGAEDGIYKGMFFFPVSKKDCAVFYGFNIQKITANKSYATVEKITDSSCDSTFYDIKKLVTTGYK